MSAKRGALALILLLLVGPFGLAGCAFYPRSVKTHVDSCDSDTYPLTVELATGDLNCSGDSTGYCAVAALAVAAVTLAVSVVIVVVGNTVYYVNQSIECYGNESAGPGVAPERAFPEE